MGGALDGEGGVGEAGADRAAGRRGVGTGEICERVGVSKPTVIAWRNRYLEGGLAGLDDQPRSGRPRVVDEAAVVAATLEPPPESSGISHWSSRLLARQLGISNVTVAKVWRRFGLQPWRRETFKFSTDPALDAKIRDVVGLYLKPTGVSRRLCKRGVYQDRLA